MSDKVSEKSKTAPKTVSSAGIATKPTNETASSQSKPIQTTQPAQKPEIDHYVKSTQNFVAGVAKGFGNEAIKTLEGIKQTADTIEKMIPTHIIAKGAAEASLGKGNQGFSEGLKETQQAWESAANGTKELAKTLWNASSPVAAVNGLKTLDQMNKLPANLTPEQRQAELKRISESNPSPQAQRDILDGLTGIPSVIESGGNPEKIGEAGFKIGSLVAGSGAGTASKSTKVIPKNNIVPFSRIRPEPVAAMNASKTPLKPTPAVGGVQVLEREAIPAQNSTKLSSDSQKSINSPATVERTVAKKKGNESPSSSTSPRNSAPNTATIAATNANKPSGDNSSSSSSGGNNNGNSSTSIAGNGGSPKDPKTNFTSNQESLIESTPEELRELLEVGEISLEDFQAIAQHPDIQKLIATDEALQSGIIAQYKKAGSKLMNDAKSRQANLGKDDLGKSLPTLKDRLPKIFDTTNEIFKKATNIKPFKNELDETILKVLPEREFALNKARQSVQSGPKFEAEVVDLLAKEKNIKFDYSTGYFYERTGHQLGEIDMTINNPNKPSKPHAVIEATLENKHVKAGQMDRLLDHTNGMVAEETPIIFYAPNYPPEAAQAFVQAGKGRVYWIKTPEEFLDKVKELAQNK